MSEEQTQEHVQQEIQEESVSSTATSLLDSGRSEDNNESLQPAVSERPEYIMEQHWDAENGEVLVEALSKSFKDTKAALDKRREESGVPVNSQMYVSVKDDGSIHTPEGLEHLPPIMANDPALESVLKVAHEREIPKADIDAILGTYFTSLDKEYSNYTFDADKVMSEIDSDPTKAGHIVSGVNSYINQLDLDDSEMGVAEVAMQSAAGVKMLAKFMRAAGHMPITIGSQITSSPDTSAMRDRWNEIRNNPQMLDNNPSVRDEFKKLGEKLFG
jgi:hypothetical protein